MYKSLNSYHRESVIYSEAPHPTISEALTLSFPASQLLMWNCEIFYDVIYSILDGPLVLMDYSFKLVFIFMM